MASDNSLYFSILIIFWYVNGTDISVNISDYLKDDYINGDINLVNQFTENVRIDNNIFEYYIMPDQIKLFSLPGEVSFYNNDNSNKLSDGDILKENYNFLQNIDFTKTNDFDSLDYQIIIKEVEYQTFDNSSTERIDISVEYDQKDFYQQNVFYGKAITIKFKLCHEYCATCKKLGLNLNDQKCETCLDKYNYSYYNDSSNCIEEGYFIDKGNNKKEKCILTNSKYYNNLETGKKICFDKNYECLPFYPYFNNVTNECHNRAPICTYEELLSKNCSISHYNNTEIYLKIINEIIQNYPISNGESIVIEGKENYIFQLTAGKNEIDSINGNYKEYNLSMINLNYCESLLKTENHISPNLSLIFVKFERNTGIAAEKNIQNDDPINKTKLNLSICKAESIEIYLSISLSKETQQLHNELKEYGYDLFNIKDSFYNDICSKYKSDRGTDVILTDRKNIYYTKETICQKNCQYSEYSIATQYLKCECPISEEKIYTVDMERFSGIASLESFYKVLKYSNYKVVKCYNLIFNKKYFSKNYGSIIVIVYFGLYLPFSVVFIIKGISPLKLNVINKKVDKRINTQNIEKRKITPNSEDNPLCFSNSKQNAFIIIQN